jgi:uncharacterized repeat protein (TIGR01451 family)
MSFPVVRIARGVAVFSLLFSALGHAQTRDLWHELPARDSTTAPAAASTLRIFEVDTDSLRAQVAQRGMASGEIELPLAQGGFSTFVIEPSDTMHPDLAAKFPQIRSLRGHDDFGRRLRLDISPGGINAMIFADDGVQVIRPQVNGQRMHESFARADYLGPRNSFQCEVEPSPIADAVHKALSPQGSDGAHGKTTSGDVRRNYRLALAGTTEYTTAVCSPQPAAVACGLAAMVTSMNRVNEVYETDLSVTMTLVANNNLLVYTAEPDPYTNNSGGTMLGQNQANVTAVIGSANYDVGHVFSTGGGGVASLGVTCSNSSKARGVTGRGNPTGDPFDIDYVAHEIGHQFAGNHTFNGSVGSCSGGNRSSGAAYEPGSGSTIQAYAGICGSQDLQPNSDPYFHAKSIEEMQAEISSDACDVQTAAGNTPPVITPMPAYTIPARTPYALLATVVDAEDDPLTYAWEQYDLGSAQGGANPSPTATTGPLVRSFNPTPDPERLIPRLSTLLGGPASPNEVLSQVSRSMRFRLTARDNHVGGGATQSADTILTVHNTGAAFAILSPNTAGTEWTCGNDVDVTWDVAGTDIAPISCAAVDLTLSQDGGINFDHVLASAVPNTGVATVRVPFLIGDDTRIRARCSNNIFFDINNADFSVVDGGAPVATDDALAGSNEDTVRLIAAADLTGNDGPGDVVAVSNPVGGSVVIEDGDVLFTPDADYFGNASFDYTIADGCDRGVTPPETTAAVDFTILDVNDAPALTLQGDISAAAQPSGVGSVANFATPVSFGPANEAAQAVQEYVVTTDADPDGALSAIAIDAAGTLSYTLSGNAGFASLSVQLRDDGGVANGGVDLSEPQTFTLTALAGPDLRVSKTNGVDSVFAGASVSYTLTLQNVGTLDVASARLLDTLPAELLDATWTCTAQGTVCPVPDGEGNVDLDVAVPVGAMVTIDLLATVADAPETLLTNTVEAILPDGIDDAVPEDNTASDSDPIVPVPLVTNLRVSKTNGVDHLVVGAEVSYTLTLENVGTADVASARLLDTLPAELLDASWTCSASGTVCPVADGEGNVDLDVALPVGASITIELVATVADAAGTTLTNTVDATLPDDIIDVVPEDNTASDSDPIVPVALFGDGFETVE